MCSVRSVTVTSFDCNVDVCPCPCPWSCDFCLVSVWVLSGLHFTQAVSLWTPSPHFLLQVCHSVIFTLCLTCRNQTEIKVQKISSPNCGFLLLSWLPTANINCALCNHFWNECNIVLHSSDTPLGLLIHPFVTYAVSWILDISCT